MKSFKIKVGDQVKVLKSGIISTVKSRQAKHYIIDGTSVCYTKKELQLIK